MTNHRLTQLDHVSQLLNVHLRTFDKLIESTASELGYIKSCCKQLMFLYDQLEEDNEHNQILKEFCKNSKNLYHH